MTVSERRSAVRPELRDLWRRRGFHTDETFGDLLGRSAARWPDRPAVITSATTTTFADLAQRSDAIASTLLAGGVRAGDVVCWMLPTDVDAIATAAAIWRIGAISSPLVPLYGEREMTSALAQVAPAAIVTWCGSRRDMPAEFDAVLEQLDQAPALRLITSGAAEGWSTVGPSEPELLAGAEPSQPEEPCLVLFTSGTESEPKGVVHSVASVQYELRSTIEVWGLTFRDRMVMASPMTHITGLLQGFLIPSRIGAAAILMDRWRPDECVDLIETHHATYMAGATPFMRELAAAYDARGMTTSSLRQFCSGGASVPPAVIRRMEQLGIAAYRAWGMSEQPTITVSHELDSLKDRSETDGSPVDGCEVRVVDADGNVLPDGTEGELQTRGPEMMVGYVRAELDDAVFTSDGWLRTGDLGTMRDGRLRVTGRLKDIVNRGGEKFSVREIEEAVATHPSVRAAAVVGVPGGRLGERVGVAVVSDRDDLTLEEIGQAVLDRGLARQKQPELMVVVDTIPTNPTGKVHRGQLLDLLSGSAPTAD